MSSRYNNNKVYSIKEEEFKEIVSISNNITDALRKIGYTNPRAGRSRNTLLKRIEELSIDISHFDERKKKKMSNALSIEELFVKDTYRANHHMKKKIREYNLIPYKCEICNNDGSWMGKELSLHLDHIDGDNLNNELSNLRFLCPNCHSQTDTYAGKNVKQK